MSAVAPTIPNKKYLNRRKASGITVRRLDFNPKLIKRHFFADSPVMSHLLTALSSTFPIGEQFFVHSVRNVRDRIEDEQLQAEIAAFIGQEAMHSKAHEEFNQSWRRDDYQLDSFQAWLAKHEVRIKKAPYKVQLAVTSAFEHFTALLGSYVLNHPEILETLDDEAVKLWVWHAIEEVEHRAVAFDVYQALYGDLKLRRQVMQAVTTSFGSLTLYATQRLFWQDKWKSLPKIGSNLRGLYLVAKMLISLTPEYLSYYKKDFHPSDIDHSKAVNYWKKRMAEQYQVAGFMEAANRTIH
ncbi:metal-dependent hydrolase [Alkanindiges sp. WGS2144]|uniref:metal-dependent hydrolase n=1 Tax=Alkanindiges sp. WGS2144 TaxID=3366808 RepID=UPI0037500468